MNIGARRLVARNRFRNTINAFTGINAIWEGEDGASARAFFTLPVQRRPNDAPSLRDNDVEFDQERKQVKFFGLFGSTSDLGAGVHAEAFAFGLDEADGSDLATRNRELYTLGGRLFRMRFEWGIAHLFADGDFPQDAPNSPGVDDTTYVYAGTSFWF